MKAESEARVDFLSDGRKVLDGLRMGAVGVWRWKIDSDQLEWTANLESVHGLPPGSFDGTLASFQRDIHPDDVDTVWESISISLRTGEPYRTVYRTAPRADGSFVWIETSGGILLDIDGSSYLTGTCLDVSERVFNELELERRLRQQQAIERFGSFALVETDLQKVLERAAETASRVLDVPMVKVLQFASGADHLVLKAGVGWNGGLVGNTTVGIESGSQAGFTLRNREPVVVRDLLAETRFVGPSLLHDHGVRSGMSVVIKGSDTREFGVLSVHTRTLRDFDQPDVDFLTSLANIVAHSARQQAAAEQRSLLLREMAHRAGNMLQFVSTIANQTFGSGRSFDDARQSFNQRLASLSRANHLIAQGGWASTRLVSLLEETLQPFRERLEFQGPDILLSPELGFDLSLVAHELATNSAKYGSLGKDGGRVILQWSLSGTPEGPDLFSFVWDDPVVTSEAPNAGGGFGSKLLRALIERKWGGRIRIERDTSYRLSFSIPLPA